MNIRLAWIGFAAALALTGCYESSGDDDAGIVLMVDGGPRADTGPNIMPPPPIDSGIMPPPPPVDSGPGGGGVDAAIPTRDGAVGAACTGPSDCTEPAGGRCETMLGGGGFGVELPGGYCTGDCTPGSGSTECGPGADCFAVGFGGFGFSLCVKACLTDEQCRTDEGYACMAPPVGGGTTSYCLPPFGGGGLPDGGFSLPDGGFSLPDASFSLPDGGITLPDAG